MPLLVIVKEELMDINLKNVPAALSELQGNLKLLLQSFSDLFTTACNTKQVAACTELVK